MRSRTYVPPKSVQATASSAIAKGAEATGIETTKPMTKEEVLKVYSLLLKKCSSIDTIGDPEFLSWGGNDSLRWSRRVLRQEGVLKSYRGGDIEIPEVVDIQLGSDILCTIVKAGVDEVAKAFMDEGISSSLLPVDEGTLVFFVDDDSLFLSKISVIHDGTSYEEFSEGIPEFTKSKSGGLVILEENLQKTKSMIKSSKGAVSGYNCRLVENLSFSVGDFDLDEVYLLNFKETPEFDFLKIDESLGIVLGWAIICETEVDLEKGVGEEYFDTQGDHITETCMLDCAVDFMANSRMEKDMHEGEETGSVVFAFPLTKEIAKAFDIETSQTGLMVAVKPDNEETLEKFRDGTFTGFSIGGKRLEGFIEEVDE